MGHWLSARLGRELATMKISITKPTLAAIAYMMLSASASNPGGVVADHVPMWLGGMPKDVPPRPGTPEYDWWQRKCAEEAAAVKSK